MGTFLVALVVTFVHSASLLPFPPLACSYWPVSASCPLLSKSDFTIPLAFSKNTLAGVDCRANIYPKANTKPLVVK